jgi:16S rRNA processing protein RimM
MIEKKFVHIGTFGQPQGLKGEIKINIFTSSLESFKILNSFFIEADKKNLIFKKLRNIGKKIIATLENCNDRDAALLFKNKKIYTLRSNFPKINDDKFYIIDLIGCNVLDVKNNIIGVVKDIPNYGAGDLIEIGRENNKDFYVPMNDENVISIDIINRIIIVNPIQGILT